MNHFPRTALIILIAFIAGCQSTSRSATDTTEARLYDGLDAYHWPIDTDSADAQRWFDQGVQLLYGFNHDEAIRSFHEAARLDPTYAKAFGNTAGALIKQSKHDEAMIPARKAKSLGLKTHWVFKALGIDKARERTLVDMADRRELAAG